MNLPADSFRTPSWLNQVQLKKVWKQFRMAFPVILFFLALFAFTIAVFGMQYTMIPSLVTVNFQNRRKKRQSVQSLVLVVVYQFVLQILAYVATLSIPFCLALNLLVPFWLIFTSASQFNQLGYFSGLMTFTFLQLMPVDFGGVLVQVQAMGCGLLFFFLVTLWYTRHYIEEEMYDYRSEHRGMELLGTALEKKIEAAAGQTAGTGTDSEEQQAGDLDAIYQELFRIQQSLYRAAYGRKGAEHVQGEGRMSYLFALMFQRAVYFITTPYEKTLAEDDELKKYAGRLAAYLKKAGKMTTWFGKEDELFPDGERLLATDGTTGQRFYQTSHNFLRMFLLILNQLNHSPDEEEEEELNDGSSLAGEWRTPRFQRIRTYLHYCVRPDAFELRFALRMSAILLVGMSYDMIFQAEHGYWLVMNAFLLLRPMYEESNYRMKTRFIGTAAGCVALVFLLPLCHGTGEHLLMAAVMVVCMYTATPGTCVHAFFVTCFALSMTTLALGETMALELRMFYVAAAVMLVLVVNRFFFPTSLGTQFRYNFQMIFHMQHMYLRLLENALFYQLDYWRIYDAQVQYHMVHEQLRNYLEKIPSEQLSRDREVYDTILTVSWRMVAEIEQMLVLVNRRRRGVQARKTMTEYIYYSEYVFNQIQGMLELKKERKTKNIEGMHYQRTIEKEPELSALMIRYAKNLSLIYKMVCRSSRED